MIGTIKTLTLVIKADRVGVVFIKPKFWKLYPENRNNPHTIPVKPIIEPTERSIPAVMITKVIPTAIIPIKEKFLVILKKKLSGRRSPKKSNTRSSKKSNIRRSPKKSKKKS